MRKISALAVVLACLFGLKPGGAADPQDPTAQDSPPRFSADEQARILAHGPWPPAMPVDPSNRFSGLADAVELGRRLFSDPRLSRDGRVACASCHEPSRGFTDGRSRAQGLGPHDRNTQTLLNIGLQRWFGWDGGADSLWAATLRPLLADHEMGARPAAVAALLREDPALSALIGRVRQARPPRPGPVAPPGSDDENLMVDAAKAIAAYQQTLVSPRTAFDDFRDALAAGDQAAMARYPASAQRGLKLFVGRGQCSVCHFGPGFSNGEFHDVGIPFMVEPGRVDPGRHAGIQRVVRDRYNLLGHFNDQDRASTPDAQRASLKTETVLPQHRNFGEWRTPSLRGLTLTAPYMHDGRLATLEDVVRHYDRLPEDRLHADGEALLKPLHLTARERQDLLAFLRSLGP